MIAHEHRSDAGGAEPPAYAVSPATRALTSQQVAAIRDVMHLFLEDDLDRGIPPGVSEYCPACDAPKPLPGFVRYDDVALCNACATDYEIARTRGLVQDAATYIDDRIHESLRAL
ncbi:MAG: hypothetical protein AB7R89_29275 [Dehalococcoidia bacterium]